MIIAQYKFDKSIYDNLIPEFNAEFISYEIIDEYLDSEDIVATSLETMLLMSYNAEPDEYGILTTEYKIENVNTFSSENIVTRTIYSNELPALLRFGNPDTSGQTGNQNKYNSLLEVLYLASSEITYAGLMFHRCANVSYICPFILTNKNNSLHGIFSGCHSLVALDVSNFDTSNVTDMSYAFYTNNLIELDLSDWDTSNVTNMNHILYSCQNLKTLNISNWNLNNVNDIGWFVNQCNNLNEIIMNDSDYNSINKVVSELPITTNSSKCNFYIGGVDDISKVNIREGWDVMNQYKIAQYTASTSGVVPRFDPYCVYTANEVDNGDGTYTVTLTADNDFAYVDFAYQTSLLSVDYLKVTNKVTSTAEMFYNCDSLISVNANDWDTSNVTEMWEMFCYCCSLETIIGIENWNTSKVNDLTYMFMCCESLTALNLSGWNTSKATIPDAMFSDCTYLEELDMSNWDLSNADPEWLTYMFYISELDSENTDWYDPDFKPYLKTIRCNNANTISLIAPYLPDRSACEEAGIIITDNASEMNAEELVNLNWKVTELIAKYTTNASGVVPTFNSGYVYEVSEVDNGDGTYTVKIYADEDFSSYSFNGKTELLTVEYLKVTSNVTNMQNMFRDCSSLTQVEVSNWDTSKVTNMYGMFYTCTSLTQLDLSNFDTNQVTNMGYMFYKCSSLTQVDVSNWNISQVTNMYAIFQTCSSLTQLDVSNWVTSKVTNMAHMFYDCSSLTQLDVSNWNTSKVTNMYDMFTNCSSLNSIKTNNTNIIKLGQQLPARSQDNKGVVYCDGLEGIDTSSIQAKNWIVKLDLPIIAKYKFDKSIYDNLIPEFNAEFTNYIIEDEYLDTEDIVITNTEIVMIMNYNAEPDEYGILTTEYEVEHINEFLAENIVTRSIYSTELPTSIKFGGDLDEKMNMYDSVIKVDYVNFTNSINNASSMFRNCHNLLHVTNMDIWDTSNVTDMQHMFRNCNNLLYIDGVDNWDTSQVTNMDSTFFGCNNLTSLDVGNWDTGQVTNMQYMFYNCNSLTTLDVSNFDTSNVISMECAFFGCNKLTSIDVSNFNTNQVTNMGYMFADCSSLTQLNLSNFNTSQVINMNYMFANCNKLTSLDVSSFNTSKVIKMGYMFSNCQSLTTLDVSNWNTSKVDSMGYMFQNCSSLTQLDVSNWDTGRIGNMERMFSYCNKLASLDTSNFNTSSVNSMYGMFQNCSSLTQLDVSNWDTGRIGNMGYMFAGCSSLTQVDVSNWNTGQVTNMSYMFKTCSSLTQLDVSNWDTSKVTTMRELFYGCQSLTTLDVSKWDTSNVTSMFKTFSGCSSLTELDVSKWNVSKVGDMSYLFDMCSSITSLDVKNWCTDKVQKICWLFADCQSLQSVDVSSWNITNVYDTRAIFRGCRSLKNIVFPRCDGQIISGYQQFWNCTSLENIDLTGLKMHDNTSAFANTITLKNVILNNSDYTTVNIFIKGLLSRSESDPGVLRIAGVDDISQVNIELAESKYWTVVDKTPMKPITKNKSMKQIKHGNRGVKLMTSNK